MIFERLIEYLAPATCLNCGREGGLLCATCLPQAVVAKAGTCYRCNRLSSGGRTCVACRRHSQLAGVMVVSHYSGSIQDLVGQLKYHGQQSAASLCARLIAAQLVGQDFTLVTAAPSAPSRQLQRGYNQAELIARGVAAQLGLPYANVLRRTSNTRQVGHNRSERFNQAEQAYAASSSRLIYGAQILIIDDVVTTGATMAACAAALREVGAKSVWGAVVAKH